MKRGGEERKKFADPDASWGHRSSISTRTGGGYYGYKLHCRLCTLTGLPVAWTVRTAKDPEHSRGSGPAGLRGRAGSARRRVLDRGYDAEPSTASRVPAHPARDPARETPAVKAGKHKPPTCDHGEWTFAGSDAKRGASKWRCPSGECAPASVWVKASGCTR